MANTVGGNTGNISSAAQHFIQKAGDCQTALKSVEQAAQGLQGEWEGKGSESFQLVMERFHKAGLNLVKELEEIAANVHKSSQAFTDLDDALKRGWDGFGG